MVVLREDGAYGFGDEARIVERGGEFDDAVEEGDAGDGVAVEVERGWVELGGEVVG